MNKFQALSSKTFSYFLISTVLFLSACSETPERFFDIAILNTNMINDFASPDLARHINEETKEFPDIPSSKKKGNEAFIPVYNNEYLAYAKLCDAKGSQSAKDVLIKDIDQKYGMRFEQNYNSLMEKGKAYAQKHGNQVNWGQ